MNYAAHWDKLGMAGSGLCLIHCLAMPVLGGFLAGSGIGFLADEILHEILALALIALAALAFFPGYRRHRDKRVILLMTGGLALISFAVWGGPWVELHESRETLLNVSGSVLLTGAHYLNHSFCQACSVCAPRPSNETLG